MKIEAFYKNIVENSDQIILTLDHNFNLVDWNEVGKKELNKIGVVKGKPLTNYFFEKDQKKIKSIFNSTNNKVKVLLVGKKGQKSIVLDGKHIRITQKGKQGHLFILKQRFDQIELIDEGKTIANIDPLEKILQNVDIVFYRVKVDENGKKNLFFISKHVVDIFGLKMDEYLNSMKNGNILKFFHKEDYSKILKTNKDIFEKKKPSQVIYRFYNVKKKKYVWIEEKGYPVLNSKGKLVEMYGIARDINERIESEINLQKTAGFYRSIIDDNLSGYYRINKQKVILEANKSFAQIFGFKSKTNIIGKKLSDLYKHSTDSDNFIQKLLKQKKLINHESKVVLKNGKEKFFLENTAYFKNTLTNEEYIEGTIFDITEFKNTQFALEQSKEKFRRLSDSTVEGVLIHNNGIIKEVNDSLCKLSGYKESEIIGQSGFKLISEKSQGLLKERLKNFYSKPYEVIGRKKNGKEFVAELLAKEITSSKNKMRVVTIRDITEKKKTEEALRLSEEKYRNLYEQNLAGVFRTNVNGKIYDCNDAFLKIFGYKSKNEFLKLSSKSLYFTSEAREKYIRDLRKHKVLHNYQLLSRKKDNSEIWILANVALSIVEGEEIIQGTLIDITNQKATNDKLIQNIDKYRKLFESASDSILIVKNKRIIDCNDISTKLLKSAKNKIIGKNFSDFVSHKDLTKEQSKIINQIFVEGNTTKNKAYECVLKDAQGDKKTTEISVSVISENDGDTYQLIIHDVTKQIQEQKELEQSKQNFENLIEYSPDGNLILHQNKVLFSNAAALKILRLKTKKELHGKNIVTFFALRMQPEIRKLIQFTSEKRTNTRFYEYQLQTVNKKTLDIGIQLTSIKYGGLDCVNMIMYDLQLKKELAQQELRANIAEEANKKLEKEIHEHKLTQEKLSDQAAKTKAILEGSQNVLIYTLDRNFRITSFNSIFERTARLIFGFDLKPDRSFIAFIEKVISKEDRTIMYERFKMAFKGDSVRLEGPLQMENGGIVWIETYINPIKRGNKIVEISCISTDVTDKKQKNEDLKSSLHEKEILLKEVHHRVKNNLQIISSILNLQTSFSSDPKVNEILKESQNRVKSMAYLHESLYQNKNFSFINFSDYLINLSKNLVHSYYFSAGSVDLKLNVDNLDLNLDQAIPCGLIVNELLTNAVKYAFPVVEKKNTITVSVSEINEIVEIAVADNGVGLPKDFDVNKTNTLGLQLVSTLTEQLDGKLEVKSDNGAIFKINFKKI